MRNTRRSAALALSLVATGSLLAGPASAQIAEATPSGGKASAEALTIRLFGQTITTSAAGAELAPALARATATQVLTPLQTGSLAIETTTIGESKRDKPAACPGSQLTGIPGVQRADVTCGEVSVRLVEGGGDARGLGAQVVLEPSVSNLLDTLQLQQPVQGGTNQAIDALNPLFEGLTGTPLAPVVSGTTDTVRDVLNDVLTLQSTARIVIAPALAEVHADATKVVAHAQAQGIRIELLPVDGAGATNNLLPDDLEAGEPLITITIGSASTTETLLKDGSGTAQPESQRALATIQYGSTALSRALGLPSDKIEVAGGAPFCVPGLQGTPLETCITLADAGVDAQGHPFANGSSIQLFKGVDGGIDLTTGRAQSAGQVQAAAAPVAPAAAAPAAPAAPSGGELPRTGGPAMLPLAGGALLALAAAGRRLVGGRG